MMRKSVTVNKCVFAEVRPSEVYVRVFLYTPCPPWLIYSTSHAPFGEAFPTVFLPRASPKLCTNRSIIREKEDILLSLKNDEDVFRAGEKKKKESSSLHERKKI